MKRLTLILAAFSALLLPSLNLSAQIPDGFDWAFGTWCLHGLNLKMELGR